MSYDVHKTNELYRCWTDDQLCRHVQVRIPVQRADKQYTGHANLRSFATLQYSYVLNKGRNKHTFSSYTKKKQPVFLIRRNQNFETVLRFYTNSINVQEKKTTTSYTADSMPSMAGMQRILVFVRLVNCIIIVILKNK